MNRLIHIAAALAFTVLLVPSAIIGCGEDDECRSDHDCAADGEHEQVCEPDGCRRVCTTDEDCPATDECVPRRVEEGDVCETTNDRF